MTKLISILTGLIILIFLSSHDVFKDQKAHEIISLNYSQSLLDFTEKLKEFKTLLKEGDVIEVQDAYKSLRWSFKKIDFLLIYLNQQEFETFINGAPLPKLPIDTDNPEPMEAQGLQVIDELMVEVDRNRSELISQTDDLLKRFKRKSGYAGLLLNDRMIFEAMRMGIMYNTTLVISGFESPGMNLSLNDCESSLRAIEWCYSQYKKELSRISSENLTYTTELFEESIEFLVGKEFNSFNRFTFTRDFLNPLCIQLLESQKSLHIEFRDEVEELPVAVNYRAETLFSEDFLNENYFVQKGGKKTTHELIALGEILFFDPILSSNNERSCASCHVPERAFTEDRKVSLSFDGKSNLDRNAMMLVNSIYSEHFFYDFRAGNLSTQFEHVFTNDGEFNTTYEITRQKLSECDEYVALFKSTFGPKKNSISRENIHAALVAYVASLKGFNSEFDQMIRKEKNANSLVVQGYNLFMGKAKCGTCHFPPTFAGLRPPYYQESESEVIGVPATEDLDHLLPDQDPGRMKSGRPTDFFSIYNKSFKTVSVRNSEVSAPYFHNGSFSSLEKVLEFYNEGGGQGLGLDLPNQTLPFDSLGLSQGEIKQIITFLHALTDVKDLIKKPDALPVCHSEDLSKRIVGGKY